uniref:Pheromone Phb3.3 B43 n=1 Tax=Coprinopsis cinerea TaxID=5346 RepID=Q6TMB5_COPCI|nr:pheromone precursor Phb3.3 B43 [Coprinopsis cinerea]
MDSPLIPLDRVVLVLPDQMIDTDSSSFDECLLEFRLAVSSDERIAILDKQRLGIKAQAEMQAAGKNEERRTVNKPIKQSTLCPII